MLCCGRIPRTLKAMPNEARLEPTGTTRLRRVIYAAGLNPSLKFGSLEEQVLILAQAFRQEGGLLLPVFDRPLGGDSGLAYGEAGIPAEALDLHRFSTASLRALSALIQEHRIEAIHWNFYHPLNSYVWALSVLHPELRHYLTDHNSRYPQPEGARGQRSWRGAVKSVLMRRFETIICVSDFVAESLRREGIHGRLESHAHFINTERFRPDETTRESVRRELEAGDKFVVLMVGYLIPEKGADVLVRAAAKLPSDVVIWIVGAGPEAARLEQMARNLGLGQRVRLLGNRSRVQPFMQAADCLACPSVWEEAAGLVNLEGLACGLPVVASRIGGIPEIVEHEGTGLLVTPDSAEELAEAIHRLFKEPELRSRMGREARSVAVERYAPEENLPEYLDLYRPAPGGSHDE